MFKKITIYLLILSLGLGFFVVQTPEADANTQRWDFAEGINDIYLANGKLYVSNSDISVIDGGVNAKNLNIDLEGCAAGESCDTRIFSTVLSKDGSTLYFAGRFTSVNNEARNGLAAVDALTGELKPWNPALHIDIHKYPNGHITDWGKLILSPDGASLYYTDTMANPDLPKIYKVNASSGTVSEVHVNWGIEDGANKSYSIQDLFISPNGRKLYIYFDRIFPSRYTMHLAEIIEVDIGSGAVRNIHEIRPDDNHHYGGVYHMAMSPDGQTLYISGLSDMVTGSTIYSYYLRVIDIDSGSYRNILLKRVDAAVSLNYNSYEDIFVSPTDGRIFIILETMYSTSGDAHVNDNGELVINEPFTINTLVEVDPDDGDNVSIGLPGNFISRECAISEDEENIFVSGLFYIGAPRSSDYEISYAAVKLSLDNSYVAGSTQSSGTTVTVMDNNFLTGELAKEIGKPTVYLLRNGYKYPILNGQVFEAWGWRWEDVKEYSSLAQYPTSSVINYPTVNNLPSGTLVKGSQAAVYVVAKGIKYPIKNEYVFEHLGFQWNKIRNFTDAEINKLSSGTMISELVHPDGLLIKYNGSPAVYLIENGARRVFATEAAFFGHGYSWGQVLNVSPTITYPTGATIAI
ncbi:MAG: hypothetical protein PHW53_00830 [Patescibacteria group bacterium]|nr:hypothetical protein [Patescibacteria group bacterium]